MTLVSRSTNKCPSCNSPVDTKLIKPCFTNKPTYRKIINKLFIASKKKE